MSSWLILFLYCFFLYGFSNMMVFASGPFKIFEHIRSISSSINEHFGSMFQCMMCFPANLGWVCSIINWLWIPLAITPGNMLFGGIIGAWWAAMLFDCCFSSGIVWFIHHIESFFESIAEGTSSLQQQDENNDIINVE